MMHNKQFPHTFWQAIYNDFKRCSRVAKYCGATFARDLMRGDGFEPVIDRILLRAVESSDLVVSPFNTYFVIFVGKNDEPKRFEDGCESESSEQSIS